jgi:hypothetical protein
MPARRILRTLLTCATLALLAGAITSGQALAFRVESGSTTSLDGKILLSPAATRITTVDDQGGGQVGPGTTARRTVIIQNRSANTVDFDLDVAEVVGSTAEEVVEVRAGSRGGAAAWVTLERQSVRLKSGQTGFIDLKVAVPKAVKPGSKPFAVTVTQRSAPTDQPAGGAGVQPIFRQVAIFIVELPGARPKGGRISRAELVAVSDRNREEDRFLPIYPGKQRMRAVIEYRNDGEVLLSPKGHLVVRNIWGSVVRRYKIEGLTAYPQGSNAKDIDLTKLPSFGFFRAKVELDGEMGPQKKEMGTFIILPWWMLIGIALLLAFAIYQLVRWWLERRRLIKELMEEEEDAGEWDDDDGALDDDLHPDEADGSVSER